MPLRRRRCNGISPAPKRDTTGDDGAQDNGDDKDESEAADATAMFPVMYSEYAAAATMAAFMYIAHMSAV